MLSGCVLTDEICTGGLGIRQGVNNLPVHHSHDEFVKNLDLSASQTYLRGSQ